MFYRRKVILGLIELLGGEVEKLRFQKLLFLYAMKKQNPEYDFVPYKFGCYSYSGFEPKTLAHIDRYHWHKSNRYIQWHYFIDLT